MAWALVILMKLEKQWRVVQILDFARYAGSTMACANNSSSQDGTNALVLSIQKGFTDVLKYLLTLEVDVNYLTEAGSSFIKLLFNQDFVGSQESIDVCYRKGLSRNCAVITSQKS